MAGTIDAGIGVGGTIGGADVAGTLGSVGTGIIGGADVADTLDAGVGVGVGVIIGDSCLHPYKATNDTLIKLQRNGRDRKYIALELNIFTPHNNSN